MYIVITDSVPVCFRLYNNIYNMCVIYVSALFAGFVNAIYL